MVQISKMIDHTLLKPDATRTQIEQLCREARELHMGAVCVNPTWVPLCNELLRNTDVNVCTVVGFPLGASASETKAYEAALASAQGANEIDMVANIGAMKDGDWKTVESDIAAVVEACPDALVKVILETCLLTDSEIARACHAALAAGADFVKTSTGFSNEGATEHDVKIMSENVGSHLGVKASGGIHTASQLHALIKAGATRIGSSAGNPLLEQDEQ